MKFVISLVMLVLFAGMVIGQPIEIKFEGTNSSEKSIKPGEFHKYKLRFSANTCFHIVVQEKNIDLKLEFFAPDGKIVNYSNGSSSVNSFEELNDCITEEGEYTLVITPVDINVPSGKYTLELEARRPMTANDQERISARQLFMTAKSLSENLNENAARIVTINEYLKSAAAYSHVGDFRRSADIIATIADAYLELKDFETATFYYMQSLDLYSKINDYYGKSNMLNNLGYAYKLRNDYDNSLKNYQNSILVCKEGSHDEYEEALTKYNVGVLIEAENNSQLALKYYSDSIRVLESQGFFNLCGIFSRKVVGIYKQSNDYRKVLETYESQVKYFSKSNNIKEMANIFSAEGDFFKELYNKENALECYKKSFDLYVKINDKNSQAIELNNIGSVYDMYGETYQAVSCYEKAFSICEKDNKYLKSLVLNNLGLALASIRDYEKAFTDFQTSLDISKNENTEDMLLQTAVTQSNIGSTYTDIGNYEASIQHSEAALEIFRKLGRKLNEAITLNNIASSYAALGNVNQAKECFSLALQIFKKNKNKKGQSVSLTKLADIKLREKSYNDALTLLQEALSLRREIKDRLGEVYTLNLIGNAENFLNNKGEALKNYNTALEISQEFFDQRAKLITIYNLALFENDRNNLVESLNLLETGLNTIESTTSGIRNKGFQSSFFANNQKFYQLYISILMDLHKLKPSDGYNVKAFEASERSRARAFLDTATNDQKENYLSINLDVLKRYEELQNQLSFLGEQLIKLRNVKSTEEQIKNVETNFANAKSELEALDAKISNSKTPKTFKVLNLSQIQDLILSSDVLIQYALGEKSYVWTITKSGISSYELPKKSEIENAIEIVYSTITEINRIVPYETETQKKSRIELAEQGYKKKVNLVSRMILPFEGQINDKHRILVCTDGKLNSMPFGALTTKSGTPLVLNYELISVPSTSTVAAIQTRQKSASSSNDSIVVFADPVFETQDVRVAKLPNIKFNDFIAQNEISSNLVRELRENIHRLPGTKKEAEFIGKIYDNQVNKLTDFNATKQNFIKSASNYNLIHLATHAVRDVINPELSCVILSLFNQDGQQLSGFLTVSDILKLHLSAKLVVLSACQTALGKEVKGTGVISLNSAFIQAGASQVISSLWSVNDEATSELMKNFYMALKTGLSPSSSLRAAQVKMIKNPKTKFPYFWAAFQIEGDIK